MTIITASSIGAILILAIIVLGVTIVKKTRNLPLQTRKEIGERYEVIPSGISRFCPMDTAQILERILTGRKNQNQKQIYRQIDFLQTGQN